MYLFVLFFCSLYLYFLENKNIKINFISTFPCFLVYFLVAGLQYQVGTDYNNYIRIYNSIHLQEKYFTSGEYIFYFTVKALTKLNFHYQSLFLLFSLFQSLPIFIYLYILHNKFKIKPWLLFFLFFCITGIYNNQLSGIRQYAALTLLPLLTYYIFYNRIFMAILLISIAIGFHQSALIFIIIFPLAYVYKRFNLNPFYIFILTIPLYIYIPDIAISLVDIFHIKYISYQDSIFFKPQPLINIITKLYYLPLILYFFYIYRRTESYERKNNNYIGFCIFIMSALYFLFLMSYKIGLFYRISSYFWFFTIIPIYYLAIHKLSKNKITDFIIIILFVLLPYILKTTILAKGEYQYDSILFNIF